MPPGEDVGADPVWVLCWGLLRGRESLDDWKYIGQ